VSPAFFNWLYFAGNAVLFDFAQDMLCPAALLIAQPGKHGRVNDIIDTQAHITYKRET